MIRRATILFAAGAIAGCAARSDSPADPKRVTLVPGPGVLGLDIYKDGRLAFGKFIDGKAAIYVANADGANARRVSFGIWDDDAWWSPDGKWIALSRDVGGHRDVAIVPADSGAERVVAATSAEEAPLAWLADGSGLLFSRSTATGDETWIYHMADGSSAKAFDVDGSAVGCPSPDGKSIAYTLSKGGKSMLWLWDTEKKTRRQLTTEGFESASFDCFSPDGRSILYRSRRTGTSDLWRLDVASGERRQLTQDVAEDDAGRWSPDGTRIAFRSNRGGQVDLWVLTTGESDVRRLTNDAVDEASPHWTPDGRSVVASVALGQQHLYALPIAGGAPVQVTSGDWSLVGAQVSRDGSRVVYGGTKNGDLDIWTVPVAGGEPTLVSSAPGFDGDPSWSPDGKQIAFSSTRGGNSDIWIAPAGGGTATRLTDWPSWEGASRWSPDGKTIAFLSNRESPGNDLWTMPAGGGPAKRLTTIGQIGPFRWSPDGKAIVISARVQASGGQAVFVVPATGGAPRLLSPAPSFGPEWSPNGREISVSMCAAGYCRIDIWSVDGKHLRSLNAKPKVYESGAFWFSDGTQLLANWQDLVIDGGMRVDVRSASTGAARLLSGPPSYNMLLVGIGGGDKFAIATGNPNGTALQRIEVPAPAK